jgi:site-specific DNA-cytosine methylase
MRNHIHQRVDAEQIDLAAHQVADSGLRDPKQLRSLSLREVSRIDHFAELDHEIGSESQVCSVVGLKVEVAKYIAR